MRKEAAITEWKKLYELATEIKALEPWKYFWDMDIIHLIDEDVYISILGRNGEAYGISVYEGEKGLNDFKILASQEELNISPQFAMYLQNNLTCYWGDREELSAKQRDIIKELGYKYRGRNQWLYFMSFKTEYIPYNFDRDEVLRMTKYFSALSKTLKLYIQNYSDVNFEQENMLCFSSKTGKISFERYFSKDIGFNGIDMANDEFINTYLVKDHFGINYVTKHTPCDFYTDNGECRLGDCRPESCKDFPYTNKPERLWKLLGFIENVSICPVAYEICERLKREYNFK